MRTLSRAALLLLTASVLAAPAAMADDDATATAASASREKQATKSRSNIQNNRQATDGAGDEASPGTEAAGVVKTKTRSNQSND